MMSYRKIKCNLFEKKKVIACITQSHLQGIKDSWLGDDSLRKEWDFRQVTHHRNNSCDKVVKIVTMIETKVFDSSEFSVGLTIARFFFHSKIPLLKTFSSTYTLQYISSGCGKIKCILLIL